MLRFENENDKQAITNEKTKRCSFKMRNRETKKKNKQLYTEKKSHYIYISRFHSGIVNVIDGCCNVGALPNGFIFVPTFPSYCINIS